MAIVLSGSFAGLLKFALLIAVALISLARHRRALHMLQLDSYSNARFARWLAADPLPRLLDLRSIGLAAVVLVVRILLVRFRQDAADTIVIAVFAIGLAAIAAATPGKAAMKKPLVWTQRAVRIFVTSEIISVLLAAMCIFPALGVTSGIGPAALAIIGSLIVVQLAGSITIAANIVLAPMQHAINRAYLRRAEQKLKKLGPKVIGITGSYGKTSTKFYLQTLLSGRFNALKTPQSFNTLMGICRVINDELKPEHEVFVAEMGAYRPGDIKELAELVHPSIGILTAIGPQHLERFGSIEAIEKTKYELIQSLPDSGTAIFNNDDERCRRLADGTARLKVVRYGMKRDDPRLNVWAEDLSPGPKGTSFTLADDTGAKAPTTAKVLGSHNIQNVLGAAAAAREMGMSLKEVARRIPLIAPAPHRLELIESPGGITVIDDSYNSNPVGALAALEVLRQFPGKHVLVTPGMVELGDSSRIENQKLGAAAARLCDYVILVDGGPKDAIIEGLVAADFNRANLFVAPDLKSARSKLEGIVAAGDTVLFENDLPDLYTSASPA